MTKLLPQEIRSAGVLQIGGPTAISPYVQVNGKGEVSGVIVELMTAVGAKLGVPVKFNNIAYSALIPALQAGRVDVGIGTFTDTLARQEQVDFVDYILTKMVLMGRPETEEKIKKVDDLCGQTVASPSGTTSEIVMKAQAEKCKAESKSALNILIVPTPAEAQLQVETGRAATFVQAYGVGIGIAASGQNLKILGQPFRPEYHGAGVKKGNKQLADALMAGFKAIMDDGSYAKILEKYQLASLAMKEPVYNGTSTKPLAAE
ncbi:transporter substrate-binding domain-containing protein [Rhizobium sp. NLR17b]|uniref:transporter substrate-binding domain-containing protein n=1 Tax=Rhizobium sp. NLR17b TaxID=2731114 RepID=UPI001C82FCE1|nr:transporter substrate-binding domain-containing protein [Rhizobium sp. NLR17b]MBX5272721.1 transporter substrate-binding domain-containing protein [Rhizobium sp. NLR17b]